MDERMKGKLENGKARDFIAAGNAIVTLLNTRTGKRFTYKVRQPKADTPHFVKLLSGPDNGNDYRYIGAIFNGKTFRHTRKSTVSQDSPGFRGFRFVWERLAQGKIDALPPELEIWHEGRCGRCGRLLTVPESVERGIGPVCAEAM